MSRMLRGEKPRRIESWADMERWLLVSFRALDLGDALDIGPAGFVLVDDETDEEIVPCAQVQALADGLLRIRLSQEVMTPPLVAGYTVRQHALDVWHDSPDGSDCTDGFLISHDARVLAAACTTWFRDRQGLELEDLGCELLIAEEL